MRVDNAVLRRTQAFLQRKVAFADSPAASARFAARALPAMDVDSERCSCGFGGLLDFCCCM